MNQGLTQGDNQRSDLIALRSCVDLALQMMDAPQSIVTADQQKLIPAAMREITAWLLPATKKQMAVEIDKLRAWARAFQIKMPDLEAATSSYAAALKHLPTDLLSRAFENARSNHKYGMRLPLPAEITVSVSDEYRRRVRIKGGLARASRCDVEIPKADRMSADQWANIRQSLAAKFPSTQNEQVEG